MRSSLPGVSLFHMFPILAGPKEKVEAMRGLMTGRAGGDVDMFQTLCLDLEPPRTKL